MSNFLFSRYFKQHPCTLMVIDDTVVLCLKVLCTLLHGKRLCICHISVESLLRMHVHSDS